MVMYCLIMLLMLDGGFGIRIAVGRASKDKAAEPLDTGA
jgi:hypothetical protein